MIQLIWTLFALLAAAGEHVKEATAAEVQLKVLSMTNEESLFIKFYAPWCGHCKAMAEDYEKVAAQIAADGLADKAHVWECDLTKPENADAKSWFAIRGFPTLMSFHNDKQFAYSGARTFDGIHSYIIDQPAALETGKDVNANTFVVTTTTTTTVAVINPVVELTDATFESLTQASTGGTTGAWFVKFYAPWCGHCKRFAPELQTLANIQDKAMGSDLMVAKADLDSNNNLKQRFNVKGYPTLKLFKKGMYYDYDGARTAEAINTWYASGEYLNAKEQGEVPMVPGVWNILLKQSNEVVQELSKLFESMNSESTKAMYSEQPTFFLSSAILIALIACLIVYQAISLVFGIAFNGKEADKED